MKVYLEGGAHHGSEENHDVHSWVGHAGALWLHHSGRDLYQRTGRTFAGLRVFQHCDVRDLVSSDQRIAVMVTCQ